MLVLGRREVGDIDLEIEGLSKNYGRICLVAKGGRKSLHRFVNALDLFCEIEVWMSASRSYGKFILESADVKKRFFGITDDWRKFMLCLRLARFVLHITKPMTRYDVFFYRTVSGFFSSCESSEVKDLERFLLLTEIYLLQKEGVMPWKSECVRCARELRHYGIFHSKRGGFFCSSCEKSGIRVSRSTMKIMEGIYRSPAVARRMNLTKKQLAEMEAVFNTVASTYLSFPKLFETFLF